MDRRAILYFKYDPSLEKAILEVHVYVAAAVDIEGTVVPSEEMTPIEWTSIADVPYDKMWADDIFWLPQLLSTLVKEAATTAAADGGEGSETRPCWLGVFQFDESSTSIVRHSVEQCTSEHLLALKSDR